MLLHRLLPCMQVYFDKALYQCLLYSEACSYTIFMYLLWLITKHHATASPAGVL
jgi:hypothetical protein